MTQTFYPRTQDALTEARYHFPTPPNASVCAFKMRTATGYTVTGLVKKKRSDGRPENMASFRQMNNGCEAFTYPVNPLRIVLHIA